MGQSIRRDFVTDRSIHEPAQILDVKLTWHTLTDTNDSTILVDSNCNLIIGSQWSRIKIKKHYQKHYKKMKWINEPWIMNINRRNRSRNRRVRYKNHMPFMRLYSEIPVPCISWISVRNTVRTCSLFKIKSTYITWDIRSISEKSRKTCESTKYVYEKILFTL